MKKSLLFIAVLCLLVSCATAPKYDSFVSIKGSESPMAQFAAGDIAAALEKEGIGISDVNPVWTIRFAEIDPSLGEQAYRVEVLGKIIEITGGDERGLMYGGLEVAEQIGLYHVDGVTSCEGKPFVRQRGFYLNVPLDMRVPSYTSIGDNAQKNAADVWDIGFWHEFIDDIARDRYNTVQLFSLNPFPDMVKVPGYEDIALDDVWRTNVPLDNSLAGNLINAVRPEDWENYTVVKKMTIDEKIAFWKEVMAYGKTRGVDFYVGTHSIYTFGEQGKHGIDNDSSNPVLKDYLSKSTKALVETYPDLAGFMVTNGENFGWDNAEDVIHSQYQWIHDVYVPAINDGLKERRDFDFVLCYLSPSDYYEEMYSDLKCHLSYYTEYSSVHMYATSKPQRILPVTDRLEDGSSQVLLFRNEDCFDMRWGDPDFMVEFIGNLPASKIQGAMTGSDGYYYGRDYSSTDPDLSGQLYTEKHWYNFMMIGRLMYDSGLSKERIHDIFCAHFGNMTGCVLLYEATSEAGKIIPQVDQVYFQDNGDYTWFVSGSWSHPSTFGYLDIKRWMKSNNPFKDGNVMSIEEYAIRIATDEKSPYTTQTPEEVSGILAQYGNGVLSKINELRSTVKASGKPGLSEKEFFALASDDQTMAYLGLYYSEKIMGAVDLRVYNETEETKWQDSSIAHLEKAAEYFRRYAEIISANYVPQHLARVGSFDVMKILESVEKDIDSARKWKPKKLVSSWNAPSNTEYFNKDGQNN